MSDAEERRTMRAKLEAEFTDLIHNDLISAAYYFENKVKSRTAKGDNEGIAFEMIAAVTMTAFAMEANLNYLGDKIIQKWNERANFGRKLETICNELNINPDKTIRPYLSIERLKAFRDMFAHGKPKYHKFEQEAIGTHDELTERLRNARPDWQNDLTAEFVTECYQDIEAIWREMLNAARIEYIDTWNNGSSGITFLGYEERTDHA